MVLLLLAMQKMGIRFPLPAQNEKHINNYGFTIIRLRYSEQRQTIER